MRLTVLVFLSMNAVVLGGHTIYVSTQGGAASNGSRERPYATLEQARDAIRIGRKSGAIKRGDEITVLIEPGVYLRAGTLKLSKEDGGSANAPVTYRASKRGEVHLYGGVSLDPTRFKPVTDIAVLERLQPSTRSHIVVYDVSAPAPKGGFPLSEPPIVGCLRSRYCTSMAAP